MPQKIEFSPDIKRLANAIAVAERGKQEIQSGKILNNNPGDIMGSDGKLIAYPSLEDGWNALHHQVSLFYGGSHVYNPTMSIEDVGKKYANKIPTEWVNNVSTELGVPPTTTLNQLLTQKPILDVSSLSAEPNPVMQTTGIKPATIGMGDVKLNESINPPDPYEEAYKVIKSMRNEVKKK